MARITPESLAKESEDSQQLALMCWCADNFDKHPELKRLVHIPNGGSRDKREAGKLVAMGVKSGFPDLFLPVRRKQFPGLFIELKVIKLKTKINGGAFDAQIEWGKYLKENGYGYKLCHGWKDARDTLIDYLEWK